MLSVHRSIEAVSLEKWKEIESKQMDETKQALKVAQKLNLIALKKIEKDWPLKIFIGQVTFSSVCNLILTTLNISYHW